MDRTVWFDAPRIESTVTRDFACSHLLPDEIDLLDKPLAFGDGLTDCTYWEWIQSKAKRLFLILVDLDLADQIFGVVDDSWEDDDLPIPLDVVERLSLTATQDPRTERKFYHRQFHYLLRTLEKGEHVDYQELEIVPLDVHERRPGLTVQNSHDLDRVGLPNQPGRVFCRRRFPIGPPEADISSSSSSTTTSMTRDEFVAEVGAVRDLQNEHVVSYWASYTHQGYGYVLFTPATEYRLGAYLANGNTPSPVRGLEKLARRRMVLDWIHCMADTLCFMHSRGLALGNIRPSTVFFTNTNHIFFSPPDNPLNPDPAGAAAGAATGGQGNSFDKETYDYSAPEQRTKPTKHTPIVIRPRASGPSSSRGSTMPSSSSRSSSSSRGAGAAGGGHHSDQQQQVPQHKLAPLAPPRTPPQRPSSSSSASSSSHHHPHPHHPHPHHHHHHPIDPQAADIFSAGCIILELLSHGLLKRSTSSFSSHRGAKHKIAGRGGAVLDSSFHKNLGQVETWMGGLARDAGKKAAKGTTKPGAAGAREKMAGARLFQGVTPILHVVEKMLSPHPPSRPSALEVQRAIYQILTEVSGVSAPHCAHHHYYGDDDVVNNNNNNITTARVVGPGARDSSGGGGGATMETIDEGTISPTTIPTTTTSPSGFGFSHHHDYAYAYDNNNHNNHHNNNDDAASTRRSNSLRSFVGMGHRPGTSDGSARSKSSSSGSSSSNQSYGGGGGERRDLASGLRAMQNLRISRSWQAHPPTERDIASRHSR
ncbi:hypothetical protein VMCG_04391 [Cytospora schulzeri]|uniref:Protein kinase domain-containing protein n=1 Tax=Cytospora schulzeri TaxID=448051 RepID=A0A423WSM9_9PEZI|nr:hypothetical protein VMCG_04391 [Valsa malicola]